MTSPDWANSLETLQVDADGKVVWVVLDRPEAANSRNQAMRQELMKAWGSIAADPTYAVVVLSGSGERFFCAGMDLKEASAPESPAQRRDRLKASRDIEVLAALPQVTIAAINGYATGGGLEMALACDLRVIADHAQVGLPEVSHGLVPGAGGTQRLPRLIGPARAAEMIFTGRRLPASEAVALGIANRSVPASELRGAAASLAAEIAEHPVRALRYAKELLRASQDHPIAAGVAAELDALVTLLAEQQATRDLKG